jgi:ferredoxin
MTHCHHLTLARRDGRLEALCASRDQTVLEAAESDGVGLPFGCRTGACASCVGRLVDGNVDYVRPPRALKPRYVEAGYVLCCIARPRTDCRIEVGADVLSDLVPRPWQ